MQLLNPAWHTAKGARAASRQACAAVPLLAPLRQLTRFPTTNWTQFENPIPQAAQFEGAGGQTLLQS